MTPFPDNQRMVTSDGLPSLEWLAFMIALLAEIAALEARIEVLEP